MKKFSLPAALVLAMCTLVGCCVTPGSQTPRQHVTMADQLRSDTVALVYRDADNDVDPFCAGVWISPDEVLTADHCVRAPIEAMFHVLSGTPEEVEIPRSLIEPLEDGSKIKYVVASEDGGVGREPKALHEFTVVKHDHDHDLALLKVTDPTDVPEHGVAPLAAKDPIIGDNVHVMGHPEGLTWTYSRCLVGAIREEDFRPLPRKGPFIQVLGPVWRGNSGGGAFNDSGELVGIASMLAPMPDESFFVHVIAIRSFLGRPVPR